MSEEKKIEETPEEKKVVAEEAPAKEETTEESSGKYFYPNKWGLGILTSTEEIMGAKGLQAMLNMGGLQKYIDHLPENNMKKEFSFEDVSNLQKATWDMYGPRGARVFAVRAGKATFNNSLAQFKSVAAAAQVAMKVATLEAKVKIGLEFFMRFFNTVSDQVVTIGEDEKYWKWIIKRCPMCWNRKADEPICYLAVGVLQAAFEWVVPDKKFHIKPVECIAMGAKQGVILIDKTPLETD